MNAQILSHDEVSSKLEDLLKQTLSEFIKPQPTEGCGSCSSHREQILVMVYSLHHWWTNRVPSKNYFVQTLELKTQTFSFSDKKPYEGKKRGRKCLDSIPSSDEVWAAVLSLGEQNAANKFDITMQTLKLWMKKVEIQKVES